MTAYKFLFPKEFYFAFAFVYLQSIRHTYRGIERDFERIQIISPKL